METAIQPSRLVTIAEAAAFTGLAESTLRQLATDGRLPGARKLGRRWRVRLASIDEWMAAAGPGDASSRTSLGLERCTTVRTNAES